MLLAGLISVQALAASPETADSREDITREAEMSLFDFLGAMVEDDEGWVDPLDLDGPAAGELDSPTGEAYEPGESKTMEEQP